jgi:hypothetical protein
MIDALREVHAAGNAFALYEARWLRPAWAAAVMPSQPATGSRKLLDEPRWADDLARYRTEDGRPTDPFDSHPSLSQRVASLAQHPVEGSAARDQRPTLGVLADPEAADRQVAGWMAGRVLRSGNATLVDWDEVTTHPVAQRQLGVHRVVGGVVEGSPLTYGELLAHGRETKDEELLRAAEFVAEWQLVEAGKATWAVDFGTFVRAVDGTGSPLVLPALDQPRSAKALVALGVDLDLEVHDGASEDGPGPLVIFPNVGTRPQGRRAGRSGEVLVYRDVLVVAFREGYGKQFLRLFAASLGRRKPLVRIGQERVAELSVLEPEQALAFDPRNLRVGWADISTATVKAGSGGGVLWQLKMVVNGKKRRIACQYYGSTLESVTSVLRATLGDTLRRP